MLVRVVKRGWTVVISVFSVEALEQPTVLRTNVQGLHTSDQ